MLSTLAMAPTFLWPVLFVTLPILVWLIDGAPGTTPRERVTAAAKSGWWFGFGYFVAGLYWIGEAFLVEADKFAWLLPFAVTALPAGLALFWGAAAGVARKFWSAGPERVLVLAIALSSAEWLRGHILTGFPWNVLGYALTYPLVLMQSAGLMGIYALTFLAALILPLPGVVLADVGERPSPRDWWRALMLPVLVLGLLTAYGAWRLSAPPVADVPGVKLRLVQPSVPQSEKWKPERQREYFDDHLTLSAQNEQRQRDDLAGITHLIWAEAAMPFLPLNSPEAMNAIADLLPEGTQLITGALRLEQPSAGAIAGSAASRRRAFNSLIVFSGGGFPVHVYDKVHLVPFGEYLPFQETMEWLGFEQLTRMRGGFSSGQPPRDPIAIAGLPPFRALVCYEVLFPGEVIGASQRPALFINLTNDGWFGDTTGPHQHFHQARVRAVEQGLPLVRVANNGISAVVDADGRTLKSISLNRRGMIDSTLPGFRPPPAYARLGDLGFALMLVASLLWTAVSRTKRPK